MSLLELALATLIGLSPGSVAAVVGMPGTGKTRLVRDADRYGAFPRRMTFDPYAERDRLEASRGRNVYPWPGRLVTVSQLCARPSMLDRDPLALVVSPGTYDTAAMGKRFATTAELAWATGDVDLICEEASLYNRQALDLVLRISSGGRHAGLRAIFIAQSLSRLHIDARRHINTIVAFAQAEPGDVDSLRRRCGAAFAKQVQALTLSSPPCTWKQGDTWSA